ncbi:hypothetical protein [Bacillus sp. JJ722]
MDEWSRRKAYMTIEESYNIQFLLLQKYGINKLNIDLRTMKIRGVLL